MTLQLNEPVEQYKEFYGRNIDQMPKLIAEGRTPLSVAGLMRARLSALSGSPAVKSAWWDNWFDLGDAIAYHPNGDVKIVPDATVLRGVSPQSKLQNGALMLEDGVYESLPGNEFRRNKLGTTGQDLSKRQALNSPVWNELARGDHKLLEEYVNAVFSEAKERFSYSENMGIYVADAPTVPSVRPWYVYLLDCRSGACGNYRLGSYCGRLVGVAAPEAPSTQKNFSTSNVQDPILMAIANGAPTLKTSSGLYVRAHESVKA